MAKYLAYYLILGLLFNSCASGNTVILQNQQTSKTISQDETKLSKEIFILIGRGYCCSGHIISINKNGEIKYLVGTYPLANDKLEEMPETYNSQLITPQSKYKPKNFKLSPEKIKSLEQLINNEQEIRFNEDVKVTDDYIYNIYLDNKKIASGYQSRTDKFPKNLKALVDLIETEVEMYELPGMA
jgi:hypothetical protein